MKNSVGNILVGVIVLFQLHVFAQTTKSSNFICISGTVLRADNNKPMGFVSVKASIKSANHEYCYTNEDGKFLFKMSSSNLYFDSLIEVNVSLAGYLQNSLKDIHVKSQFIELGNLYLTKDTSANTNRVLYIRDAPPFNFESETPWQRFKRKIRRLF
ncbi:MAG: hypothetical protein RI955_1090, partial [Bacteroidota bacterium]